MTCPACGRALLPPPCVCRHGAECHDLRPDGTRGRCSVHLLTGACGCERFQAADAETAEALERAQARHPAGKQREKGKDHG
jgi:hypothetical protein